MSTNISVINIDNQSPEQVAWAIHTMITNTGVGRNSFKKKVQHRLKVAAYDPSVPYEPSCGDNITNAIRHTIALANHFGTTYTLKFNSNLIPVAPNSDSTEVYMDWERICREASEAWKNSSAGQAYYKEQEEQRIRVINEAKQVISKLDSVNWNDMDSVIDYLAETVEPFDWVYVAELGYGKLVNKKLLDAGYVPNVNCGDKFNEEDKNNVGLYLIGQAMSCFNSVGCIHSIFNKFYEDYKEKFTA